MANHDDPLADMGRPELLHRLELWNRALRRQGATISLTVEEADAMPLDDLRTAVRGVSRHLAYLIRASH